ncbi:hypothetical protein [Labrys sp. 22185]|uniref:hypothetical protein n=1 Tax=Labrys sp. 22185 TaxID=3453888 RepID=UPI003F869A43
MSVQKYREVRYFEVLFWYRYVVLAAMAVATILLGGFIILGYRNETTVSAIMLAIAICGRILPVEIFLRPLSDETLMQMDSALTHASPAHQETARDSFAEELSGIIKRILRVRHRRVRDDHR